MSPEEERLVLELHARWGNRWSRIARRLPGRTDNEIKNYWRTHMRKRAQERKRSCTSSSSSSLSTSLTSSSSSSSLLNLPMTGPPLGISMPDLQGGREGCSAAGGPSGNGNHGEVLLNGFPMEQIWNVMESSEMRDVSAGDGEFYSCKQEASLSTVELSRVPMLSPPWDCSWDTLWKMDEEEYKILLKQDHHQGSTET